MEKTSKRFAEIGGFHIEKPEIPKANFSENLVENIGKGKLESLKKSVEEIYTLIKEREELSEDFSNEGEKLKTELNNFIFENEIIEKASPDPREMIKEKNALRHKKIEISEMQLNEKITCWKDIALLKKELRENERELAEKQETLYNFILDKLNSGKELKEIEKLLENGLSEKLYTFSDILTSVNCALRKKLEFKKEVQIQKQMNEVNEVSKNLTSEENKMISFLRLNPSHEFSTVELYKKLGLSTRKGNIVKESLTNKKLISTQEVKYNQGWKKHLRLSNHIQ